MAFDALNLAILREELAKTLVGGRISKIFQPQKDEILLNIFAEGNFRLIISSNASTNRIHLTEKTFENPQTAPAFCMLLRKHLSNAQILDICQLPFERVLDFTLLSKDQLGYDNTLHLIFELTGKTSNIILTQQDYTVIDSIKHLPQDLKSSRFIVNGMKYEFFPPQQKIAIDDLAKIEVLLGQSTLPLRQLLVENLLGVSVSTVNEILYGIDENNHSQLNNQRVLEGILRYKRGLLDKKPNVVFANGSIVDVCPFDYQSVKGEKVFYPTLNQAHDYFFYFSDRAERLSSKAKSINTVVKNAISRTEKKLNIQRQSIIDCKESQKNKNFGELILANIHLIKSTDSVAKVVDFFDPEGKMVEIPLEVGLSPQQNAQKYFKKYRKQKSTIEHNSVLVAENQKMLDYLLGVQRSLKFCTQLSDLAEISLELMENGIIKKKKQSETGKKKAVQTAAIKPLVYNIDDFLVYVGKNNIQNNHVTFGLAKPDDIWLHTQKIHSSHVLIVTNGRQVPNNVLEKAAEICVYFSQARNSSKVLVDITQKSNVKKPNKAALGFVVYSNFSTVVVNPCQHSGYLVEE